MARTPTPSVPPERPRPGGGSRPDVSLGAEIPKGLPPPRVPEIVTGEKLGQLFDLSTRSIREYRSKGVVVRAGAGYDLQRSVVGMMDHLRIEALRKLLGDSQAFLINDIDGRLSYDRQASRELDQTRAALHRLLALPAWLAPAVMAASDPEQATRIMQDAFRDALGDLLTPDTEEPDHGDH